MVDCADHSGGDAPELNQTDHLSMRTVQNSCSDSAHNRVHRQNHIDDLIIISTGTQTGTPVSCKVDHQYIRNSAEILSAKIPHKLLFIMQPLTML